MKKKFLHEHKDFPEICEQARQRTKALLQIVEKDYWLMHVIWALKQSKLRFELKGGTSLSKAWNLISRFSEDVDVHIHPPPGLQVYTGKNHDRENHIKSRKDFFDWLAENIVVPDVISVQRNSQKDDSKRRNGAIEIGYPTKYAQVSAIKPHILLEVGFAQVKPNELLSISSWVMDIAIEAGLDVIDNRAIEVPCYLPEYTLVEKLSAISQKYRREQEQKLLPENFIRHYYDIYQLLGTRRVQDFLETTDYKEHKHKVFGRSSHDRHVFEEALCLPEEATRRRYEDEYEKKADLYYFERPTFTEILSRIQKYVNEL